MPNIIQLTRLAITVLTLAAVAACGPSSDPQSMMAKVQEFREKGDSAAAIIELKNVLQKNPDHAEARYWLGVEYLEGGDARSAVEELRRAQKLGYDPGKVLPLLGKSLLETGKFQEALDETDPARAPAAKGSPEILNVRGIAQLALSRVEEAKQSFEQALALRPDYAAAFLGQARIAASGKQLEEASSLIERAIASDPNHVDAWLMKGDLARAKADTAAAMAAFQKVIDLKPKHVPARLNIASLQIAGGNFEEAGKQVEEVRKLAPKSPIATYLHALIEFRKQNIPAAHDAALQVLKVLPDHLPSVLLAGATEYALGNQAQAQSYLQRVVDRQPGNLYARKLLVSSLAKGGQLPRAIEVLQTGLQQAPADGALMALAGELYMQSNEFAKATQFFEKAAKLDPKNAAARTGLGLSRLAAGETDHALSDLESAGQLDSGKFQADILLVMSHLRAGNFDRALKALAGLEKKQPDNPLTYNLKAAIYLGKKDTASARKYLERALELQPTYVAAAANLAQLDLQDKNPQAARRRFEAILEKDKDNVQALMSLADFGPRLGATQKDQIEWLERAKKASPGAVQPQLMLVRFYAQTGDVKKALEVALQAQTSSPGNPEVLDALGSIQLAAGEKNQAVATYTKLATLQPKSALALFRLARAQAGAADPAAAGSLKKALALKPDFVEAQVALAEMETRAGRITEALKIAQAVQKQSARNPQGYVLEGDVLMVDKKFQQAAKAYETAYAVGKSGAIAVKLHAAYSGAGKPEEGDARLAQWLKASPDDAGVRLYAADASLKAGKYQKAIEQYEWLIGKQPDNLLVLNNLAWAYQQVKDPRALEMAERAYKLKPDNAAVVDTLGWMLVEQGNAKRGLELLQKAIAGAPDAVEIRFHLAQALAKSGDKAQAISQLERVLDSRKKFPQEAEALALLKQLRN